MTTREARAVCPPNSSPGKRPRSARLDAWPHPTWLRAAWAWWRRRQMLRQTHAALVNLEERALRDIGLDRSEISSIAHAISLAEKGCIRFDHGRRS